MLRDFAATSRPPVAAALLAAALALAGCGIKGPLKPPPAPAAPPAPTAPAAPGAGSPAAAPAPAQAPAPPAAN